MVRMHDQHAGGALTSAHLTCARKSTATAPGICTKSTTKNATSSSTTPTYLPVSRVENESGQGLQRLDAHHMTAVTDQRQHQHRLRGEVMRREEEEEEEEVSGDGVDR